MHNQHIPRPVRWDRPDRTTPIVLQPRDIEIVRAVFRHRFARPEHIQALLGSESLAYTKRRLRQLWENAYLARPRSQRPTRVLTEEMIYSVAKRGAVLLERGDPQHGIAGDPTLRIARLDWAETPDKQPGWLFVDHQLLVTDIMVCLELATRRAGLQLSWKGHHWRKDDIIRLKDGEEHRQQIPDARFALVDPGRGAIHHYLEADRGRPLKRMREKYELYLLWRKRRQQAQAAGGRLPFVKFRVVTVTTDLRQRDALRRAAADVGRDRDHQNAWRALLFAHCGEFDLARPERLLEPIFTYADSDEPVALVPPAKIAK